MTKSPPPPLENNLNINKVSPITEGYKQNENKNNNNNINNNKEIINKTNQINPNVEEKNIEINFKQPS